MPKDPREPVHHATVKVDDQIFRGYYLKSLVNQQRNVVLIPEPHAAGLRAVLSKNQSITERINEFNGLSQKYAYEWKIGRTATFKKIERLARIGELFQEFNTVPIAHHHGAVPALPLLEVENKERIYSISILPSLGNDVPLKYPDEEHKELLLSYQEYLPNLFTAYYEQIGYYFRVMFFGADDEHVIKYAHRIRSNAKRSIRGKLDHINATHVGLNRLLSEEINESFQRDIPTAKAVDAFAHLICCHIYSFYCIDGKEHIEKYEKRLSEVIVAQDVLDQEHPAHFLQRCIRHVNTPEDNDKFIEEVNKLKELKESKKSKESKDDWRIPFGEAAAYVGEIKRSCKKGFSAPTIFVGYHFDIDENEKMFHELSLAIEEHWPKVQLFQGRHLDRNIRWSLLGKIWFADVYLFLIPPTFIIKDGTPKPLKDKEDWLLLEFIYTTLIAKHTLAMRPKSYKSEVFEAFKKQLETYAPDQEIPQVTQQRWRQNLATTKSKWFESMRVHVWLKSMDCSDAGSLESFEINALNALYKQLIGFFFMAAYWYLDLDALKLLQIVINKLPSGQGEIETEIIRKQFLQAKLDKSFPTTKKKLLSFHFDIFGIQEPLVIEEGKKLRLRLTEIVRILCKNFQYRDYCENPTAVASGVITEMLSPRRSD